MSIVSRTLSQVPGIFAICRLGPEEQIPDWALLDRFSFSSCILTRDELSVICPQQQVPDGILADRGWRCLKLEGPFDLSEPGVLASMVTPLAQAGISVFAEATYDTDYLLIKEFDRAVQTLRECGHRVLLDDSASAAGP